MSQDNTDKGKGSSVTTEDKAAAPVKTKTKKTKSKKTKSKATKSKATKAKTTKVKAEKPKAEKPKADKAKADKPKALKPKAEKPKADKPKEVVAKAEKPKAEKPKVDKLVEADTQASDANGNVANTRNAQGEGRADDHRQQGQGQGEGQGDGDSKPRKRRRSRRRRKSKSGENGEAGAQHNQNNQNNQGNQGNQGHQGNQGNQDRQDRPNKPRSEPEPLEIVTGIYEQGPKADGRLRQLGDTFLSYPTDPVVASHLVEKYNLRPGMMIECSLGKPFGGGQQPQHHRGGGKQKKQKYSAIDPSAKRAHDILKIEDQDPAEFANLRQFGDMTIIMPEPRLTLEYPGCPDACRLIDMFCPIGYGTRGMIVSPPKAGKTTLLQNIAMGIRTNHPECEVYALLIDERPEEVTEFRRNVPCTVWASSNDHTPERHCGLAIAAIERCRRLAEMGKDVVVLMDSLTRLGRAFNTAPNMAQTGRTLSGGLDAGAMTIPKQIFGAARKFEEGGSLTIIASALVDTGSRGDQVIFEEFKGTGNMELILDRKIAEQRIFPAIDLAASGTRNEDRLIPKKELLTVNALRRRLLNMNPVMQVEQLLKALNKFETNAELVGSPQTNEEPQQRRGPRRG